jgi:hypothetical protein
METSIIDGGIELIDEIAPLWTKLNIHHAAVSPYFSDDFRSTIFENRKVKFTGLVTVSELSTLFA